MASPESSSQKSKQLADHEDEPREEEKEAEEPPSSIDKRLVDALDDPQYASTLLHMDSMMQQLITQQPDPYEVYFAPGSTTDLLRLGSILAFHYNLQPYVGRGIRLIAKKTPESCIPSVTLSSISNQRRHSGGTSSGNVSELETAKPENLEKGKDEEPVNTSAPVTSEAATSTATLEERNEEKASSSLSAHDMAEEKERARTLDERNGEDKLTNPLSNLSLQGTAESEKPTGTLKETKNEEKYPAPVDPNLADVIQQPQVHDTLVSNPVSSEVSSSIPAAVMIKSEVVSSSTSAKVPEGGRPAVRPSPSSNQSFKSTTSVNQSGRGTSHRGPVTGHHPQGMQQRGSVSQPASAPDMLPYGNYIVYNPYHASRAIYYPVYSEQLPGQYTQTYYVPDPSITQNTTHASGYHPTYSSSTQCPPLQHTQTYNVGGALNLGYSDYTQVQYPQPIILVSPQQGASTSHSQPPQPSVQYPQPIYLVPPQQHGATTSQHPRPLVQYPQPVIAVPQQHGASTSQHPLPLVQYPQPVIQVPQQHGASASQPPRPLVPAQPSGPPQPQRPVRGRVQPIDQEGMDRLLDEHDQHFPDLFSEDAIDAAKADPRPAHEKIAGYINQEGFS